MKLKLIIGTIILCGAIFLNVNGSKRSEFGQTLTLESVIKEAVAGTEGCLTTPNENTGECKAIVGGGGYACVVSSWTKNCSGS